MAAEPRDTEVAHLGLSMKRVIKVRAAWLSGVAAIALTGCSGGGGGGGSSAPPPPPPPSFGTFGLGTTSLNFVADGLNTVPASQVVTATITGVTAPTVYIRVEIAGTAVANVTNIAITSPTTGQATVVPQSAGQLGLGTHTGTLTVYACVSSPACTTQQLAGSPATVNVTYTVRGIQASVNGLAYTLGNSPTPADKTRSFTISGHPSPTWTASAGAPWLTVSPTSGDTAGANSLTVTINDMFLMGVENGVQTSAVTLTPSVGAPVTVPIALTLLRTQLDFVSPYVALANVGGDVIIRGAVLDDPAVLANGNILLPSQNPPNPDISVPFTSVSSTEIRVTHPALAAGSYPLKVGGMPGAVSKATLVVVTPTAYAAATLPYPFPSPTNDPTDILYDAPRRAVSVRARPGGDSIEEFAYTGDPGDPWFELGRVTGAGVIDAMALARDGGTIVFTARNIIPQPVIAARTADSMQIGAFTYAYPALGNTSYLRDFAIANDGRAVLVVASDVSASRPAYLGPSRIVNNLPPGLIPGTTQPPPLVQLLAAGNANPNLFYDGAVGASLDGSRVLIASSDPPPTGSNLHEYNASTGVLSDTALAIAAVSIELDRKGTRVLLTHKDGQEEVYGQNLASLGTLPAGTLAATLSPDGTRVYTYDTSENVRSFDISGASVVPLGSRAANGSAGDHLKRHVMTITPDGQTLFIAGSVAVLVEPVP